MTTFHDLFRQPTRRDGEALPPDRRSELLPALVERSRKLHLWRPGQPTSERGPRLLIGVAAWSGYDMNLLDLVEEAVHAPVRIDVFDLDELTAEQIDAYIPQSGAAGGAQSPFVGLWEDGRLVERAAGYAGRQLVLRVCDIDPALEAERMQTVYSRL